MNKPQPVVAPAAAVEVQLVPVETLVPYGRNARIHTPAAVARLAKIICSVGWTSPILIDGAGIVAGHKRRLAALSIYRAGGVIRLPSGQDLPVATVPVINVSGWSEEQRRAYIIADNQTTLESEWDGDVLRLELAWLQDTGFEMALSGFDGKALAAALMFGERAGRADPDDAPAATESAVSRAGDIWVLGRHRLCCGSSTEPADVAALLAGAKPHLMVTDPPYGVTYDASWRDDALGGKPGGRATGKVKNDAKADWREAWALFPGDVAYVWHAGNMAHVVAESLLACDFGIRAQIIWGKSQFVIGRGDYHPQHEPCWYAVRKNKKGHYGGGRNQSTLWSVEKPRKSDTGHSTQKPVECMRRPIVNNSNPGDGVYEPFSGSGTTLIAAEMEQRSCFAMELHPPYVDVAVKRWQTFTGQAAVLASTGDTFEQVTAARAAG